ncbi:protein ASPARTIC PROTEASE IN GUARD CELL 1 [Cornus florida]|uniref:protein ASPARTIC PROTEASE IN GUARD CELL 1 n=1 Tax=Cornus florida TaxID=4283 RepID=UPI00289E9008|nr:protein ASPARTIC PROTEASE IN GUARD CELL 1 [Cornus florida]
MGQKSFLLLHILFALTLSLYTHSVLSRTLTSHSTAVLDVSASIQRTRDVFSLAPQSLNSTLFQPEATTSSSFSLSLHPRSSIHKSKDKDYRLLTLSRLERDSARVKSLTTKLELAINAVHQSDLNPVETSVELEEFETPLTSGASQGSGEYFSRVGVGRPVKPYYMVIDTGSDISWLQCQPCSDCYQQSDPVFDPSASSSYSPLSCNSKQCSSLEVSACSSGKCMYQVAYGDGSYTVGDFATETVSFGNSGSVNNVALGCGHENEGLFIGAAGLLGLGGGSLSLPSQIKASSFSYCLVDRDSPSSSTLDFNSASSGGSVTAPLLRNSRIDTFLYVGLTGLGVGGQMLSIPPSVFAVDESGRGGIIVDSGTAVTRLQTQAYDSLRDAFVKMTQNLPSTSGFALFDTCYDLSSMTRVSVPTVSFHFAGGKTLSLHPKNYLIPVDNAGKFCFAFAPTQGSLSIIGNIQQQGTRVSYDLAHSLVGFSPDTC